MRILIEEYQYNVSDVHDVLYGIDAMENVEGKVSIHYVGYYYNALLGDCVFILPKVLLRDVDGKELAFGKYQPYDIINPEGLEKLTKEERDFLYGFAVWIYRAIVVYKNDKRNDSTIVYQKMINQVGGSSKRKSNTFLDILLSLIQFNKDNKSFFFFVLKNLHSGLNKINWTRTISTTSAIIQGGDAIYLNPVNKKRKINFDEELLVIFFSILNYIGDTYGFPKEINCNFDLIKGKQFEKYRNGYTWKYIPANKSILINGEDNSFVMLRMAFVDENILAFQLDGTDRYAFMIDENNKALFAPKTLEELNTYLVDKLDTEKQKQIEQQNKDNELAEKAKQEANRERAEKIKAEIQIKYQDSKMTKAGIFGVLGVLLYVLAAAACSGLRDWLGCVLSLIFAIASTCFCIYYCKQGEHAFEQKIKEYKENNPNDPCIVYL